MNSSIKDKIDEQLKNVSELMYEENGDVYRIINGKKFYQSPNVDPEISRNINAWKSSGKSVSQWLNDLYR